ncbi:hypothetical protein KM043_000305 [Ampulex compressa]|nr:hypothetical protein KM043_000305 [Ampulex compressa]
MSRQSEFLADRRVSQAEIQRRHTWLRKTRLSVAASKHRCRVTHEVRFPESFNGLYTARFSQTGEFIAVGFGTGAIQIRNGESGELRATLRGGMESSFPVMCCRFNPVRKDLLYASGACGNIFMCTTDTNEFSRFIAEPRNEINAIDVSVNGDYLVSGGKDAAVRLYDAETAKLVLTYEKTSSDLIDDKVAKFHRMRIFATRFHSSYADLMITGGWDDTVRIWDMRIGNGCVRTIKGPHVCGDAIDVRESNILTGSWVVRDSLQLWDMMSAKLIETINPENRPTALDGEFLYVVQYFDGDPYGEHVLAGGSGTSAVEVISLKEKKIMGSFGASKPVVALDSSRTGIVFGGMESVLPSFRESLAGKVPSDAAEDGRIEEDLEEKFRWNAKRSGPDRPANLGSRTSGEVLGRPSHLPTRDADRKRRAEVGTLEDVSAAAESRMMRPRGSFAPAHQAAPPTSPLAYPGRMHSTSPVPIGLPISPGISPVFGCPPPGFVQCPRPRWPSPVPNAGREPPRPFIPAQSSPGSGAAPALPCGQPEYAIGAYRPGEYEYVGVPLDHGQTDEEPSGPSTAEIIANQSQDYVDEKLAEYQATIQQLQGE